MRSSIRQLRGSLSRCVPNLIIFVWTFISFLHFSTHSLSYTGNRILTYTLPICRHRHQLIDLASITMSFKVELPYDIFFMVTQHVDDFDTIYSLRRTNSTFAHLTEAKFWENLYLTTPKSVTSALLAILKRPSLRPLVRLIRLPDSDDRGNPAEVLNLVSAVDPSDEHARQVLDACFLQWPPNPAFARADGTWNWTEGMTAAIMTLCPNLETAVVDSDSHRRLNTLRLILQMTKPFTRVTPPRITHWKVIPDALANSHGFNSLGFILTGSKRVDLIPYPSGWQFNIPAFPWLRNVEELRIEDDLFVFENGSGNLPITCGGAPTGRFPGDSALYQDYHDFIHKATPKLYFLRDSVRRLHWKFSTPIVYPYQEDDIALIDEALEAEDNFFMGNFDEDVQEITTQYDDVFTGGIDDGVHQTPAQEDIPDDVPMEALNHDDVPEPILEVAWDGQEESETQPPVEELTANAPTEDERFVVLPSLAFAQEWTKLTHLETTTGSVYGHPGILFEQGIISDVVPSSVEVLVLEERWLHDCQPDPRLLGLYRYNLYRDLSGIVAQGPTLPNLQRVVFIPDPKRGYWPGLRKRVEWVRGPDETRGRGRDVAFREMKDVVDSRGGMRAASKGLKLWLEQIKETMSVLF